MLASERAKIEELYSQKPGLTCAAIAQALGYSEIEVRTVLRYPPLPKRFLESRHASQIEKNRPSSCPRCDSKRIVWQSSLGSCQIYLCRGCGKRISSEELVPVKIII